MASGTGWVSGSPSVGAWGLGGSPRPGRGADRLHPSQRAIDSCEYTAASGSGGARRERALAEGELNEALVLDDLVERPGRRPDADVVAATGMQRAPPGVATVEDVEPVAARDVLREERGRIGAVEVEQEVVAARHPAMQRLGTAVVEDREPCQRNEGGASASGVPTGRGSSACAAAASAAFSVLNTAESTSTCARLKRSRKLRSSRPSATPLGDRLGPRRRPEGGSAARAAQRVGGPRKAPDREVGRRDDDADATGIDPDGIERHLEVDGQPKPALQEAIGAERRQDAVKVEVAREGHRIGQQHRRLLGAVMEDEEPSELGLDAVGAAGGGGGQEATVDRESRAGLGGTPGRRRGGGVSELTCDGAVEAVAQRLAEEARVALACLRRERSFDEELARRRDVDQARPRTARVAERPISSIAVGTVAGDATAECASVSST